MFLKPEQLSSALQKNLLPVYFISGDEPLQLGEIADTIRAKAKSSGFYNREIFSADMPAFNWHQITQSAANLSIFADKKLLDIRISGSNLGQEGTKVIMNYCQHPVENTLLLITAGKIAKDSLKARWLQALDKVGIIIQVWPIDAKEFLPWLQQRLQRRGLITDHEGLKILASRVEGNLLAATQEIEKLYVLYGTGQISSQQIINAVADNSRYDVYKLVDAAFSADINRVIKILDGLITDGIAAPIVLWAITKEARMLVKIKTGLAQGQQVEVLFKNNQVNSKRKHAVNNVLNRLKLHHLNDILLMSAKADRQSKGLQAGNVWETLLTICLLFIPIRIITTDNV